MNAPESTLFTSAADTFGGRVVGVVLTGGDRDATDGVQSIKQIFAMPRSAIETGCVDRVLPVEEIGPALTRLAKTGAF